jgi:hypothetical protein
MCMMVYIGSDNPLPIIEYQGEESSICTSRIADETHGDDNFAKTKLTKKYKYSIGSWQGCSCGFHFDENCAGFSEEDNERGRKSVKALFKYIAENVEGDHCELMSFWAGEGMNEPDGVIDIKNLVLGDSFELLEGQYVTVKK